MPDSAAPPDSPASPESVNAGPETRDVIPSVEIEVLDEVAKRVVPSWVSVAQDKRSLKKYDVEIQTKDGLHKVEIPDDVLTSETPLWEDFVVGKFLDLVPHVAKVHMVLNKIWKYGETSAKIDVYDVNATTMRFRVPSSKAREKILRRGMWNIAGVPMVVTKWTPRTEEEKPEEEAVPMWVHLRRVPLHMFSWEGLSFITSAVGFPVKLQQDTIACSSFEEAKVFAKVNVSKDLPETISFSKNGKEFEVDFHFPWLPSRCKQCGKWGHIEMDCGVKGKDKEQQGSSVTKRSTSEGRDHLNKSLNIEEGNREIILEVNLGVISSEKSVPEARQSVGRQPEERQPEKVQSEERQPEEVLKNMGEMEEDAGEKSQAINSWALVSPGKVGRSPLRSLQKSHEEELLISASKFSVLRVEDQEEEDQEDGEIREDWEAKEVEVEETRVDRLTSQLLNGQEKKVAQKGGKKAKSLDANPMSTRSSSRRNH
ncbi:hypothetical protein YC2023_011216 [Brassica napus]